jgi:hypothetical protein
MSFGLALLCDALPVLGPHARLIDELGGELSELLVAAPSLEPLLLGAGPAPLFSRARLVASVRPETGLLGALQSALLAGASATLLALDAAHPPPAAAILRRLLLDPRPGQALVYRREGALHPLPGRFRRGCLGPISRALALRERELLPFLRRLRCPSLEGAVE